MPRPTAADRAGTLYVVATPIGNLEDITLRALRILKSVALVAAEDTRRTAILLRHYDIATPLLSVHEHNERDRVDRITDRLGEGDSVALVTDAGTPAVSDPGAHLVAAVREAGFRVEPIPGPSAVLAALSASGVASDGFAFVGFPPNRLNARTNWLASIVAESSKRAVVLFEAPHRIQATLRELSILVKQPIMLGRELTKAHEEIRVDTPANLADQFAEPRGEFTLVIPRSEQPSLASGTLTDAQIADEFGQMTLNEAVPSKREAVRKLATRLGLSPKAVYASLERNKIG
jgi:16S rRNA (cytidine1402-2'-O)-methyltransferase